jgi:hypothetical protein
MLFYRGDFMRAFVALAVAGGVMIAGIGCGPVYNTEYQFSPPDSDAGRACVFQCENSRQQCRQLEEYRADDCQRRASWDQQRCEDDIYRRKGREPKWYECGSESCSADYDRCDESYRSCYQSCGGKVNAETRCVANCDKIPPQQQPGQ